MNIETSNEILWAIGCFQENALCLEVQVWEENSAKYFEEKGYAIFHSEDGSWWVTDESRYLD